MRRLLDDGLALKGAGAGLLAIALVLALMGAATQAFAEKADGAGSGSPGAADAGSAESGGDRDEGTLMAGALRLGHVSVECVDLSAGVIVPGDGEDGAGEAGSDDGNDEGVVQARADEADADGEGDPEGSGGDEGSAEPPSTMKGCELALGVPQQRMFRITNQGEAAYVRLSVHTLYGELDHNNGSSLEELDTMEGGAADPGEDDESPGEAELAADEESGEEGAEDSLWFFAEDGYWYRAEPLEPEQTIVVRMEVEIPLNDEWRTALNTGAPSMVEEGIDVDAMQARNVAIDAQGSDPWGIGSDDGEAEAGGSPGEGDQPAGDGAPDGEAVPEEEGSE